MDSAQQAQRKENHMKIALNTIIFVIGITGTIYFDHDQSVYQSISYAVALTGCIGWLHYWLSKN